MRDVLVTLIIVGSLPIILARPFVGMLMWSWVSYMNPHRMTWGFAFSLPFAQIVAVTTVIALVFSREPKKIPVRAFTVLWASFLVWMLITTYFALSPGPASDQLMKVLKIQFFILLTMMLVNTKERIEQLIWVIVLSIGFFSVKGGLFTLVTGGSSKVYGPPGGFIEENNALAVATLMVIPLMHYLRVQATNRWVRMGLMAAMVLSAASALGSQSRGAFIAGLVLLTVFWLKSRRKALTAIALVVLIPPLVVFMPQQWWDRIHTITSKSSADVTEITSMRTRTGEGTLSAPIASRDRLGYWPDDFSALGRVNAWNYAINVANSRITGAGLESWDAANFARYAPIVEEPQSAHSIFFSVLGDHGWIGLLLFLAILGVTWRDARWIAAAARASPDLMWAGDLARMIQLSVIAYGIGGAFLSLAYYDLPWHLVTIVMMCRVVVERQLGGNVLPHPGRSRSAGRRGGNSMASPRLYGEGVSGSGATTRRSPMRQV